MMSFVLCDEVSIGSGSDRVLSFTPSLPLWVLTSAQRFREKIKNPTANALSNNYLEFDRKNIA